jgi:starch-binding outer membrane protein, SusD/RagB family
MKRKYIIFIFLVAVLGTWGSCKSDFLTVAPTGTLTAVDMQTVAGLDGLLVGAYSMIDGVSSNTSPDGWESTSSNWVFGSIRAMEANKGTDGGDQPDINPIQTFSETPTNPYLNYKWREVYEAIYRCNTLITFANKSLAAGTITQAQNDTYVQQAKVLRGWYHFEAWRMWGKIPYIDETVVDPGSVENSADNGPKIIADLQVGLNLPINMGAIGKFNKTVSEVLVAKALMQINHDYAGALTLLEDVVLAGKKPNGADIGLAPTFGEIFNAANRNDIESVYTVQTSVNDGSGAWNAGAGEVLNFPYKGGGSPGGCCGFFDPTQEFVNSFDVDANGLPMLDFTYNSSANQNLRDYGVAGGDPWDATKTYSKNQGCTAYAPGAPFQDLGYVSLSDKNTGNDPLTSPTFWVKRWTEDNSKVVDPRLDWSVGRRGIPYWDWGVHTGSDWIRDQTYSGPYSPKKQVYKKSQEGSLTSTDSWTSGYTANGYRMIRYADVLLMIAECQIEGSPMDLAGALDNINQIRNRAANPAGYVYESDGTTPAATYMVKPYPSFADKTYAEKALFMERKLELGQEGHRWFDLNRWGTTQTELTRILNYEKTMPWGANLYGNATVGASVVKYPIPQRQIDLSNGKLTQN